MIIHHPLLGPRDASEFSYLGDAALIHRPCPEGLSPQGSSSQGADAGGGDAERAHAQTDGAERDGTERDGAARAFHDYLHLRDNPAGVHRELWYHGQGDRSWLVVTRNTLTHEISKVELASDVARREGRTK